ncbi:PR-1-like protein [Coniochaeta ligniaria NRRL 30616]|uniref:PR-1-like protein n=1 Tax=Coniochaeta ligniaria NRRL 30616 TaxID=1408157 RepID=A0A1J7JQL0_9PEZI|nr:PR-1-like protein [Coniochaeta ligniaria NRRL 30616]
MGLSADQQQGLNIQNNGRKQKGLAALQWDDHLAQEAQKWANNLAKNIGHMQHSTSQERPNQGENLFWGMASPGPYKDPYTHAAQGWMNEAAKYHGEKIGEGNFAAYGHYTQCMWKSTTHVGMAAATDNKGGVYVVGRYSPPGNWTGQKPY